MFCVVPQPTVPPRCPDEALPTPAPGENNLIGEGIIFCLKLHVCSSFLFSVWILIIHFCVLYYLYCCYYFCYGEILFLHYIGPISAATFYGAAASTLSTHAQPDEFHVVVHPTLKHPAGKHAAEYHDKGGWF